MKVNILDQADDSERIAIALQTIPGDDCCVPCTGELPLLRLTHILVDGVLTHTHRSADDPVASPALGGLLVLTTEQVRVDSSALDDRSEELLVGHNHSIDLKNREIQFVYQLVTAGRREVQCLALFLLFKLQQLHWSTVWALPHSSHTVLTQARL